jgi:hypothetical protein
MSRPGFFDALPGKVAQKVMFVLQMTCFTPDKEIAWFDPEDLEGIAER